MKHALPTASGRPPSIQGFSVLEILVAVSLLAVIIVGLLAMFYQTQRAFRSGVAQSDVAESGRLITQILARELQEIAATGESNLINLLSYVPPPRPDPSSSMPLAGGATRLNHLQDVTFVSRINDEWVATAYRYSLGNSVDGAGGLHRWTLRCPSQTNDLRLLCQLAAQTNYIPGADNENFHFVADGIVHLQLMPYDTNGYSILTNLLWTNVTRLPGGYAFISNDLPAYLDLELGILEPKAAERFRVLVNSGNRVAGANYLAQQAGRVHLFKQRIPIRNTP